MVPVGYQLVSAEVLLEEEGGVLVHLLPHPLLVVDGGYAHGVLLDRLLVIPYNGPFFVNHSDVF